MNVILAKINDECEYKTSPHFVPWATQSEIYKRTFCTKGEHSSDTNFCPKCIQNCQSAGRLIERQELYFMVGALSDQVDRLVKVISETNNTYRDISNQFLDKISELEKSNIVLNQILSDQGKMMRKMEDKLAEIKAELAENDDAYLKF